VIIRGRTRIGLSPKEALQALVFALTSWFGSRIAAHHLAHLPRRDHLAV
jgi:hypothetical protein